MLNGFHRTSLAKPVYIALLGLGLALAAVGHVAQAKDMPSLYFGRWTVDDPTDKFSANGKLYRMIDIAPCGADFCGVSVREGSACGATLFRFLASHANAELLTGHGKWGGAKKKMQIISSTGDDKVTVISIGLGGGDYDITAREGSMPTFEANYHKVSEASCTAGATS
jgi:hypothetical protein